MAESNDVLYQPEFCEFAITFPGKTYDTQRCNPDNVNQCVQQKSYTQVFDNGSTVNFRASCSKSSKAAYQGYTEKTTKMILKAMTKRSVVQHYNMSYREDVAYKQAGLVGEGQSGKLGLLYLAQIWVGNASIMNVEAELIGEENQDADMMFRDVLRSVAYAPAQKDSSEESEEREESENGSQTDSHVE